MLRLPLASRQREASSAQHDNAQPANAIHAYRTKLECSVSIRPLADALCDLFLQEGNPL
jgi:hypothetical protein